VLRKETVRELSGQALTHVIGGQDYPFSGPKQCLIADGYPYSGPRQCLSADAYPQTRPKQCLTVA
jgi:hypothetical protein